MLELDLWAVHFCSSLDGIWTHTIDTLQHQSLSLMSYVQRPRPLHHIRYTDQRVVLAIYYVYYPIFLRSRSETFVSPHYYFAWPITIYLRNEFSLKRAHANRGFVITMLRFLTENGRNRSNSRQLLEILLLVKLKHYEERKTTF